MSPINILHVIPKLTVGGVENQLLMVLKKYNKKEFSPVVCCLSDRGDLGLEIESCGVELICLNKLKHTFDWTIIKDIYQLIKQKSIKVIRTHQYHANLYGRCAAILAKVPCIVASVHNVYTIDKKIHRRIINKFLARYTDKIIAVSKAVKHDILLYDRISHEKICVIYNGIEMRSFLNLHGHIRGEFGVPRNIPLIGTVGRLTAQKGHRYLLEAIDKLKLKFPGTKLLIAGDGPLKNELEKYAQTLNIHDKVIFLGLRRDIPDFLSSIDIFVLPSLWEGLSNALIEAMASGKPVIATDIPPIREIINSEELGILVPPENSDAIADALEILLYNKNRAEAFGKAASEKAFSAFTIENTVEQYTFLFENILRSKNALNSLSLR
jgi:glycosyltransferase involved in cell wall biosynthesis